MTQFIRSSKKEAMNFLRYIGPGLLVTVGFIDPGNWASNIAAGSGYGYTLLWMVTLSTIMLVILQHNAAHLGIVTGKCLSEATSLYINKRLKNTILLTAVTASIATAMAELLGGAMALEMLFHIPVKIGTFIILGIVLICQFTNAYSRIEKLIILFVSLIGFSFLFEICIADIEWKQALIGWVKPEIPKGSLPVVMSVLGAVVMPHNLFLHSEIIQSREWNLKDENVIEQQLKYEFKDTLFSMIIGWAINSAMILMAAAILYQGNGHSIDDIHHKDTKLGVLITMIPATLIILLIKSPFDGLIYSQMFLAVQLPITIFTQIYLTSSKKVMGKYANSKRLKIILFMIALIVTFLNICLFVTGF